jgi:hypothetical protein
VGIYNHSQRHECVEIGTEIALFHFWENLLQIFGNVSLQCMPHGIKVSLTNMHALVHHFLESHLPILEALCPFHSYGGSVGSGYIKPVASDPIMKETHN